MKDNPVAVKPQKHILEAIQAGKLDKARSAERVKELLISKSIIKDNH